MNNSFGIFVVANNELKMDLLLFTDINLRICLYLRHVFSALCVCMVAAGMNEDGSFIGQYGRKRRPPPQSHTDSASQAFATLVWCTTHCPITPLPHFPTSPLPTSCPTCTVLAAFVLNLSIVTLHYISFWISKKMLTKILDDSNINSNWPFMY